MNRFRTMRLFVIQVIFWGVFIHFFPGVSPDVWSQDLNNRQVLPQRIGQPVLENDKPIYADIDTSRQQVFVLMENQLWRYDLKQLKWNLDASFDSLPVPQEQLEFGLNQQTGSLLLWSDGVGKLYEIDIEKQHIKRIDRSYNHKNQYGHFPFFREGKIHAFGGYGLWQYKNYITYYTPEVHEWTITSVDPKSPLPIPRVAKTGMYDATEDALYIYGGTYIEENRPDDKYMDQKRSDDIWKFSFDTETWKYITEMAFEDWEFKYTSAHYSIGRINTKTTSVYSTQSNNWYIPLFKNSQTEAVFYLAAFNIRTNKIFKPVEVPLLPDRTLIVTNYLFNPKTSELVFVGKSHMTNEPAPPVKVYTVAEDSLLKQLDEEGLNITHLGALASFGGIFVIVLFLIYRTKNNEGDGEPSQEKLSSREIANIFEHLNEQEKRLVSVLYNKDGYLESHELEEETWPHINNYDYRRKMRNETIKSVNRKFSSVISGNTAVLRKKDPNDNRRYLYGLHDDILKAINPDT